MDGCSNVSPRDVLPHPTMCIIEGKGEHWNAENLAQNETKKHVLVVNREIVANYNVVVHRELGPK